MVVMMKDSFILPRFFHRSMEIFPVWRDPLPDAAGTKKSRAPVVNCAPKVRQYGIL